MCKYINNRIYVYSHISKKIRFCHDIASKFLRWEATIVQNRFQMWELENISDDWKRRRLTETG